MKQEIIHSSTLLQWSQHRWMKTLSAVCHGSEWQTHWTQASLSVCAIKSVTVVVTDMLIYFLEYSTAFNVNYQPASDVWHTCLLLSLLITCQLSRTHWQIMPKVNYLVHNRLPEINSLKQQSNQLSMLSTENCEFNTEQNRHQK